MRHAFVVVSFFRFLCLPLQRNLISFPGLTNVKTLFSGPLDLSRFVIDLQGLCTLHALNINLIAIQLGAVSATRAC